MPRFKDFVPHGVIPATLLAFDDDFAIDEAATRAHLSHVAGVKGISAITINAHASEVHACSLDEQRRILDIAIDEIGDSVPLINGIYADGSLEAAGIARMAEDGGASCLLVFPPHTIGMMDGQKRPEMALAHFSTIAAATDLPIIVFQYPGDYAYPMDTLLRLFDAVPAIKAIKDWNPGMVHERHIRTLQTLPRPINVLSTNSAWLMSSLTMGCSGLLSGAGSVIADLQVALFEAVGNDDLARARRLNDRIYPLAQCFYAVPFGDMHNRMKEALVILGRMPRAVVRPPLVKLPADEIVRIADALKDAGIRREGALLDAA
jgi:4-hydroxy-tetrahydrodipicolinate synthase